MMRCFPWALDFGQSNGKFYGISALFKHFCLAPQWIINWTRWTNFIYISQLKSLNLVLIPGVKLNVHRDTWAGYICDSSTRDFLSEFFQSTVGRLVHGREMNYCFLHDLVGSLKEHFKSFGQIVALAVAHGCHGPRFF